MKKIDNVSQEELVLQLREVIDSARITHPLKGPSPTARRNLRRLIRENPTSVRSSHVLHNIGPRRREWLQPVIEEELGL